MILKRKFTLAIVSILTIAALLFTGCSNVERRADKLKRGNITKQNSNTSSAGNNTTLKKDARNITDNDLINSAMEDSSVQLDSLDDFTGQMNSDELDLLLNDNSDLNNIPSNFSVQ